jgi:hypothetical protein
LARRLLGQADDPQRVRLAYELTTGREPDKEDMGAALAFVERYQQKLAAQNVPAAQRAERAWAAMGRVLLTGNGFLFVD